MLSLRTRLLIGVGLWTLGLILVLATSMTFVWHYMPTLPFLGRHGSIHVWVTHSRLIFGIAIGLLAAGVWQVRRGLQGLGDLRQHLADVHVGRSGRVTGRYVPEVQPVVDELNALLEHRDAAVKRAVAKAGDLAHGLKTPLAVLMREAEVADAAGQAPVADGIRQQVERMRRQVDYHLAHARAAASGAVSGGRAPLKAATDALVRTLQRLHAERQLTIDVDAPADATVKLQPEDLDEVLGNVLDNACKWTRSRVEVRATQAPGSITVTVDDDGPGLAVDARDRVLERGVRADQRVDGTGLGLSIVRDVVELYGGAVVLDESPLGGLRVRIRLPAD